MKRLNKKLLTLALAGACAASLCAATINVVSFAEETTEVEGVSYSSIFGLTETDEGKIDVYTAEGAEEGTLRFTLANEQSVYLQRDLALKWHESATEAGYLQTKFSFANLDFDSVTLSFESGSTVVNEEEKAVNVVEFSVEGGQLKVAVNGGTKFDVTGSDITLNLAADANDTFGAFAVKVNGAEVGTFVDVGGTYADYARSKLHPLTIEATAGEEKQAILLFKELNGQRFDNIKDGKIIDTAAPILVLDEEISSFQYGTAFSLSYEKIDVLYETVTENKYYYQYNPADTEPNYDSLLTTSTYFMDTVYYVDTADGNKAYTKQNEAGTLTATSVYVEEGKEFISIKFKLNDKAGQSKDYFLSWYATATEEKTLENETDPTQYLIIDANTEGATYSYVVADETEKKNRYEGNGLVGDDAEKEFELKIAEYASLLQAAADEVKASSSSSISLPSLDWLIGDNGGYRGLRFTISYKTPSSTSTKTASNLLYNGLKFTTSEEGTYFFKVFANDVGGNTMKYYLDEELVSVSNSNIWDIKEIPTFSFKIKDNPISVKEATKDSDKKVEKIVDTTYTLSGITVEGATKKQENYALYRFDDTQYAKAISDSSLLAITYKQIVEKASAFSGEVGKGKKFATHMESYVYAYAALIAESVKGAEPTEEEIDELYACFIVVNEYNAEITEENDEKEWNEHNRYQWDATSKSFRTVEEGRYFIFADFYEDYLPTQRAAAYKMIVVESKADIIDGESQFGAWVKNNVVSVVLFGIAGLMLIAIVILLLIHPSDETLEDVDAAVVEKKKAKKKNKTKKK